MGWISVSERYPEIGREVKVRRDAGVVHNPSHPGYPSGVWEEWSKVMIEGGGFFCDAISTGVTTHWYEPDCAVSDDAIAA